MKLEQGFFSSGFLFAFLRFFQDLGALLLENYRAARLYDAIYVFARAVELLSNGTDIENPPKIKCEDRDAPFEMGASFMETISKVKRGGSKIYVC